MNGDIADETAVEVCPEKVHPCIIDENANLCRIRPYFTKDAWLLVKNVIKQVEKIRHDSAMFARMMLKKRVCPVTLV